MFYNHWIPGAILGLTFALFSSFFYSYLYTLCSVLLLALSFVKTLDQLKIILLISSGFLWTSSFNKPQPHKAVEKKTLGSQLRKETTLWLRKKILERADLSPWLQSLILGDRKKLSPETKENFSSLGAFHLLVLSGLHMSIFVFALFCFLYFPLIIAYSTCLISCGTFFTLQDSARVLVCFALFFYGYLIGFPSSVQRASLFACVALIQVMLPFSWALAQKLLLVLFLQILCFPTNFLSLSTLLSWGSMLLILELNQNKSFVQLLKTQLLLTTLIAGVCGKLSLLGIVLNYILVPLFSFTYILALLPLLDFLLPPAVVSLALEFQRIFLGFINKLGVLPKTLPWLYFDLQNFHYLIQFLILVGLGYYFCILVERFRSL